MKKYRFLIAIALIGVAVVGCKDFLDINTNPNAPTVTVPGLVLSGALVETARISQQDFPNYAAYWAGYASASGTYSSSGDVRRFFNLTNTSFQGVWTDNYLNASNYLFVEKNTKALAGYDYFEAIAKIMKVYNFQMLIDNYGNIPYSQSLKGFGALSPTYDDASSVYESLSLQLDTAVSIIQNAPANAVPVPSTVDVMFGGDMTLWAKLANTFNLRLLLHQSEIAGKASFITTEIGKITANGAGFLGVGEDALINPGYAKATGLQNPLWESNGLGVGNDIGNRDYMRASEYGVNYFANRNDPRLNQIFRPVGDLPGVSSGVTYKGIPFGQDPDLPWTTSQTSAWGLGIMGSPAADVIFMSAAQSLFLQAEAVHRGWIAGGEQALYESGITESFRVLGVPDYANAATAYYTQSMTDINFTLMATPDDKLEGIIRQKWAANYITDSMEAWNDLRRLGIPSDLPQSLAAAKINPTPPIRLLYPQTEYSNNAGAVAKAVSDQGLVGNYQFASPVFWDITP